MTPDERFDFEERAALVQYLGGIPRAEAERLAAQMIARQRERVEKITVQTAPSSTGE